jgi:hypothetical protein
MQPNILLFAPFRGDNCCRAGSTEAVWRHGTRIERAQRWMAVLLYEMEWISEYD